MPPSPYAHLRFPPQIIQRAVSLCFRFALSWRDIKGILAELAVDVSREAIRRARPTSSGRACLPLESR